MIKYLAAFSIFLLLMSGCSTQTKVVDHYINVDRVISVPCDVKIPEKPKFAVDGIKKGDFLPIISDAYMIERHQRKGYEGQLESALTACVERPVKGTGAAQ